MSGYWEDIFVWLIIIIIKKTNVGLIRDSFPYATLGSSKVKFQH
jgi:hypothetical protein